jgi:hypothetical protein
VWKKGKIAERYRCCEGMVKDKVEGKKHMGGPLASPQQAKDQPASTGQKI